MSPKDAGFGIHVLGKDSCCSQGREPPTAGAELSPLPKIRKCWITTGLSPLQNPKTKLSLGSSGRSLCAASPASDVGNLQENPLEQTFLSLNALSFPWAAGITSAVGQPERKCSEKAENGHIRWKLECQSSKFLHLKANPHKKSLSFLHWVPQVHPGEVPTAGIPNSCSRCVLWTMLHPKGAVTWKRLILI